MLAGSQTVRNFESSKVNISSCFSASISRILRGKQQTQLLTQSPEPALTISSNLQLLTVMGVHVNSKVQRKYCQQPTCISLEDINNVRNSKESCKSKMAQISEEMGSLSHPSPEFCYDKHTRSQKNDRMVSQYLALCNLTAYFFCG